jgi:hypothetical protein
MYTEVVSSQGKTGGVVPVQKALAIENPLLNKRCAERDNKYVHQDRERHL